MPAERLTREMAERFRETHPGFWSIEERDQVCAVLDAAVAWAAAMNAPDGGDGGRACYEAERNLLALIDVEAPR